MAMMEHEDDSPTLTPVALAKRRARNRNSQRSFRERQARYVKELELKAQQAAQADDVNLKLAEERSSKLEQALETAKTRITDLYTALGQVAQDLDNALKSQSAHTATADSATVANADLGVLERADQNSVGSNDASRLRVAQQTSATESDHTGLTRISNDSEHVFAPENACIGSYHHANQIESNQHHADWMASSTRNDFVVDPSVNGSAGMPKATETDGFEVPPSSMGHGHPAQPSHPAIASSLNNHSGMGPVATLFPAESPEESINLSLNNIAFPPGVISFPSVFSAHLAVIEHFARKSRAFEQRHQADSTDAYSKLLSTMVNMFVNACWPGMWVWWTFIQSSVVVEKLMRWKLDQCLDTYKPLPVTHRPTALQICTAHPPIIDWAFFPSVRDRLIEHYSHSWLLDELVCELVEAYVVEADLTNLVSGMENLPPQKGYFRVWDIVQTVSSDAKIQPAYNSFDADLWTPMLDLNEDLFTEPVAPFEFEHDNLTEPWTKMPLDQIYKSRKAAWKLFKLLRMEDRRAIKVDPVFATAHPDLCDDSSIIATGMDCTLRNSCVRVPRPKPLTREAIMNYKMMLWKSGV